jgi:hypothetical protein
MSVSHPLSTGGPLGPKWQPVYDRVYTIMHLTFNLPHMCVLTSSFGNWHCYMAWVPRAHPRHAPCGCLWHGTRPLCRQLYVDVSASILCARCLLDQSTISIRLGICGCHGTTGWATFGGPANIDDITNIVMNQKTRILPRRLRVPMPGWAGCTMRRIMIGSTYPSAC